MPTINSINGPTAISDLGWTLSHEHLTNGTSGMQDLPGICDTPERKQEIIDRCIEALKRAKSSGINSLIDLTPFDLGRQAWLFESVAEQYDEHGVNIICATGVYRWIPSIFFAWDIDEIASYFSRELTEGIAGSSIKAGIIKLAWDFEARLDEGPGSPRVQLEKTARAAARAARATGSPISCHTRAADKLGLPLLDIFEDEGLDLGAVTIGHSNDTSDMTYLTEIAKRGAVVGLDRFFSTDEAYVAERSKIALNLVRAGFAKQISLGHDGSPAGFFGRWKDADTVNLDVWKLVPDYEVPWLRDHGVSESDIRLLTVDSVAQTFLTAKSLIG
tara:strand:- start:2238 stop:3230 length:993 start_codon:yes stop_codon:yes gene_type:complete